MQRMPEIRSARSATSSPESTPPAARPRAAARPNKASAADYCSSTPIWPKQAKQSAYFLVETYADFARAAIRHLKSDGARGRPRESAAFSVDSWRAVPSRRTRKGIERGAAQALATALVVVGVACPDAWPRQRYRRARHIWSPPTLHSTRLLTPVPLTARNVTSDRPPAGGDEEQAASRTEPRNRSARQEGRRELAARCRCARLYTERVKDATLGRRVKLRIRTPGRAGPDPRHGSFALARSRRRVMPLRRATCACLSPFSNAGRAALACLLFVAGAQACEPPAGAPLRVAVYDVPPYGSSSRTVRSAAPASISGGARRKHGARVSPCSRLEDRGDPRRPGARRIRRRDRRHHHHAGAADAGRLLLSRPSLGRRGRASGRTADRSRPSAITARSSAILAR